MSSNRDFLRPDRPSRGDYDDDYDDRYSRPRYGPRYGAAQDEDQLRILSVLYYVLGALSLVGGLVPLLFVFIGVMILDNPRSGYGPDEAIGWMFIGVGTSISVLLLALAALEFFTGYSLSVRKNYVFCFVIACLTCLKMPLGTVLGVFTILVLNRPTVKEMFNQGLGDRRPAFEE